MALRYSVQSTLKHALTKYFTVLKLSISLLEKKKKKKLPKHLPENQYQKTHSFLTFAS